jgi:hypothetical protein
MRHRTWFDGSNRIGATTGGRFQSEVVVEFRGADPEALDTAAGRLEKVAAHADTVVARLRRQLTGLVYRGPGAEEYRSALSTVSIPAVEKTAGGLRERAGELKAQAQQQRRASGGRRGRAGAGRGQSRPAPAPKPPPPPPWIGQKSGSTGRFKGVLEGEGKAAGLRSRYYVVYDNEIRVGGSAAWRNNNPGNLTGGGEMSKSLGAIGHDRQFAVFPNKAVGDAAMRALIQQRWPDQTIREMISGVDSRTRRRLPFGYAPESGGNNPTRYAASVGTWTGLNVDGPRIRNLTPQQMDALVQAMQRYEHTAVGKVVPRQ